MNLGLQVINMGRNNKRMRQELLSKARTNPAQQFWTSPPIVYLPQASGSPRISAGQDIPLRKRRSKTPPPGVNAGDDDDSNSPQAKRKSIEDANRQATLVPSLSTSLTYPHPMYYYPPPPGFAWIAGATPAMSSPSASASASTGVPFVHPGWDFHASHHFYQAPQ